MNPLYGELQKQLNDAISKKLDQLARRHNGFDLPEKCYRYIEEFVLNGGKRLRSICIIE